MQIADSQFGHVFYGKTEKSEKSVGLGVKIMVVQGEIHAAVEYLVKLLESEAFKETLSIRRGWMA